MGTVTISGNSYTIYGTHAEALIYAQAQIGSAATLWVATTEANRNKTLVSVTRMIDSQTWAGQRTDSNQALAFPRTGLVDRDGNAVDSTTVPDDVVEACYRLAILLFSDPSLQSRTADKNTKRLQAGTASITYFRPTTGGAFPLEVQNLLSQFRGSTSSVAAESEAGGVDEESQFDDDDRFDINRGL